MLRLRSLALMMTCALAAASLSAQSYETAFAEPTFDTAKAPKDIFGDVKVDPATGRVTMDVPMGPGIGGRGAVYQPTLRMRESYVHTYQQQIYEWYLGYPIAIPWEIGDDGHLEGFDGQNLDSSTGWTEVHGGESTQSLLPGYFTLGLPREAALRGWDRTSQFEVNGQSGVLNPNAPLPSNLNVAAVLTKFGYDSTVTTGTGPGFQLQPGPWPLTGQFMQMASNRYLVMALSGGASHQYDPQSFQEPYYTGQATQASYPYWVPGAFLVVDKDVAYEFTFAYTKANTGSYLQTAGGDTMKPAAFKGHGIYRLSRILNAFGDQITFTYGATPGVATSQITTHWIRNGTDTGMGVTLTAGAQGGISVAYTGLPQTQPISYTVGTAGGMWGSWITYDQDHEGFWEGCLTTNIPALPDQPWAQIPVSSVVQDQTQERIDFTTANSVVYSKTGSAPTRTVRLHWSPETPFFMTQKANKPYPGRAWTIGVNQVDDIVPGPSGSVTRSTTYSRTIPVPNTWMSAQNAYGQYSWVADPNGTVLANPVGWPAGSVSSCKVTHPDGRWVLYTYAPPSTSDFGMNYLLFVKNFPIKEEWHGSDDSLERTITYSNYDAHSPGNPAGTGLNPTPTATHWEIQDTLAGRWEIHDLNPTTTVSGVGWDATNLGWTGEQVLIKDLSGTLIADRTMQKTLTSNLPYFLYAQDQADTPNDPAVRVPVTRSGFDSKVNLYSTATYGDQASGPQVTLHTDWNAAAGLLSDAWLDYAGVSTPTYGAKYTYDSNGFMNGIAPISAAYANLTVSQTSNGVGWPLSQTDPNALTTSFTWDAAGRLSAQGLPNGELGHGFAYDPGAQTVAVSRGVQNETHYYNGFGEPIRIVRDNGDGTFSHRAFGYDGGGRLLWETVWRAGTGTTVDWTSPLGPDDTSVTTPGWTEVTSQCALRGVDADGNPVCLRYRTIDHPAVTVTTFSRSTHYVYDGHNRLTSVTNPNQEVTATAYAPPASSGSSKTITLAPGTAAQKQQTDTYDALGRLVKVTAVSDNGPLDSVYTYDNADRVKSVTQWSGPVGTGPSQVRTWAYDSLGRLTTLVQPESGTTTYSNFLPTGKPQTTVYGYGSAIPKTLTATYDPVGRILSVTSSDSSVTQSFSYDQTGHGLANGKLTNATNNGVGRSLTYSGLNGRLSSLVRTVDGKTFTQSMGYDASYGFLASRTYPDGKVQTVGFDLARNLPTTTTFYGSSLASFTYDPTSWMPVQISYANAATTGFTYGPDQVRLTSMTHTIPGVSPLAWGFSYNEAGELGTDGEDWYSHDKLGRLTGAFMRDPMDPAPGHGLQQAFSYDAFGNRTALMSQKVTNWNAGEAPPASPTPGSLVGDPRALSTFTMTGTEAASMAATNQLPTTIGGTANTGAHYDYQGNLTSLYTRLNDPNSQVTANYDALGRVSTMGFGPISAPVSQTYGYDDEGLRIKTSDSATGLTTYNIYDEGRRLIAQATAPSGGSLTWKKDILYVGDKEIAERDSAGKTWVQFLDHLGSPRLAWDGSAVTSIDGLHLIPQKFAPFGEALNTTSAAKFAKGFTNHEQTDASGLIYMQARFYAPMYGRFLSPDPARDQHFEETQSWNIYSYVQNDPTMRIDPTGMSAADASAHTSDEEARKKAQAQADANKAKASGAHTSKQEEAKKAAVVYGETSSLSPAPAKDKDGKVTGVDSKSAAQLQAARENIADVSARNHTVHSHKPSKRELKNPQAKAVWEDSQAAAKASDGSKPGRYFFIKQAGQGRQRPDKRQGFGQGEPVREYGPFRNAGGGDVPKGDQTYVDIYDK